MSKQFERKEIATEAKSLEYLSNKNQYAPESELEALMMAIPLHQEDDVYSISPLRQAVMDCVDQLSEREKYCIDAIFSERITYAELGERLGYKPQKSGSPQAYMVTKAALANLKDLLLDNKIVREYLWKED